MVSIGVTNISPANKKMPPIMTVAGLEREQLLYLVRNCIHLSAEFTRRRSKLLGMLDTPEQLWWLKGTLGDFP